MVEFGILDELIGGVLLGGATAGSLALIWALYRVGTGATLKAAAASDHRARAAEEREEIQRARADRLAESLLEARSVHAGCDAVIADLRRDLDWCRRRIETLETRLRHD